MAPLGRRLRWGNSDSLWETLTASAGAEANTPPMLDRPATYLRNLKLPRSTFFPIDSTSEFV